MFLHQPMISHGFLETGRHQPDPVIHRCAGKCLETAREGSLSLTRERYYTCMRIEVARRSACHWQRLVKVGVDQLSDAADVLDPRFDHSPPDANLLKSGQGGPESGPVGPKRA